MSAEEQAEGLARVLSSAVPYFACLALSWAAYGGMVVQIVQLNRSSVDSAWRKLCLCVLFLLSTADMAFNLRSLVTIEVDHFGDLNYVATAKVLVGQPASPFLELGILFACQVFLIRRCYDFIRSLRGTLSTLRRIVFGALVFLSVASFVAGAVSQHRVQSLGGQVAVQIAAHSSRSAPFHVLEAAWLATSLAVDIGLTATITCDLHWAMSFGANDMGVGANVRQIMRQLFALASVNGIVLVVFQLCFLVVIMVDNASWSNAALVFLPSLQLLSVLTLVNMPRTTLRVQASRRQSLLASTPGPGPALPLHRPPTPYSPRQPLSALDRGRRKLAPFGGKWRSRTLGAVRGDARSQLEARFVSRSTWPAFTMTDRQEARSTEGRVLGLQEVLGGFETALASAAPSRERKSLRCDAQL